MFHQMGVSKAVFAKVFAGVNPKMVLSIAGVLLGAMLWHGPVKANETLAKQKACLACHQVERKVVGPAFKDVAARYKGKKDAVATLTTKVKNGGKGSWGEVPMPAQNVTDAEAKQLAEWVLSLK